MKNKHHMAMTIKICALFFIGWLLFPATVKAQESKEAEYWKNYSNSWTKEEKLVALSKFWMQAKYNFAYMDKIGHERWDSLYQSFITPAMETKNDYEFHKLICRFCAFLKDEHTTIRLEKIWGYTTDYFADDWLLCTEYVDGKVIVKTISSVKAAEVPVGSEIIEVNDRPVKESLDEVASRISASTDHVRLKKAGYGLFGSSIYTGRKVKFRRPDGKEKTYTLYNDYQDGYHKLQAVSLPASTGYEPFRIEWYPGDVAYVKIGTFMPNEGVSEEVEKAMPELQKRAKKLIIDLRNNGGGNSEYAGNIMGHFVADTLVSDGRRTSPTYNASYASWGAGLEPKDTIGNKMEQECYLNYHQLAFSTPKLNEFHFSKEYPRVLVPTLVLINNRTCSASENALVMLDGQKHIKLMGQTTSGSTGNPVSLPLIRGLSCRICTLKDTYPDGREFVGVGIKPTIEVKENLESYLIGKDVVLEAAMKHMGVKAPKKTKDRK